MINDAQSNNKNNRKFGLVLGAVLAVMALYQYIKAQPAWPYFACCSLVLLALGSIKPSWLSVPRMLWEKLSHYLGYINTHIWLTLIYILVFVPINLIFKMIGRDPLNRKYLNRHNSYWLTEDKPTVSSSLKKQF
ncbi:SxtJ family membrane protein [Mucilaginibacter aquaedulcis]|uniref:SxtJ family membrane protein n=1 Tax=Mucilaginibacter aquaedulcis TaxID=1187081 RepID=UPI0025B4A60F|nr:SxtJ family membrane protein [Mucilaginibacter aquaedulcis]MDN3548685.1 SxtJ family membrane protein [Mucilaginibacter aquaedulcis]